MKTFVFLVITILIMPMMLSCIGEDPMVPANPPDSWIYCPVGTLTPMDQSFNAPPQGEQ